MRLITILAVLALTMALVLKIKLKHTLANISLAIAGGCLVAVFLYPWIIH